MKAYYEAYDQRYRAVHEKGLSWASEAPTPLVREILDRFGVSMDAKLLEMGCGEGRDARALLRKGRDLTAGDISEEAIDYCRAKAPEFADRFKVMDCLYGEAPERYDFIYAVAVLHMLVRDEDRDAFYGFIRTHLLPGGKALVLSMGDGETERAGDPDKAFDLVPREHPEAGTLMLPATSARMVSFEIFEREIRRNGFRILEKGLTASPPEFDSLLYAVIEKA